MFSCNLIYDRSSWDCLLRTHDITDVYYQYSYVQSMAEHMSATPVLVHCTYGSGGFIYALIISDIANDFKFKGLIDQGVFFDAETPYGYGGPMFYGDDRFDKNECRECLRRTLDDKGIITQFIRFYPLIFNEEKSTVIADKYGTYKSTIFMDLSSKETIRANLDSQYRRKIRKASEAGVMVEHDKGQRIDEFIRLYDMTMDMHEADEMYFFKKEYYNTIISDLVDHIEVFYACLDGKTLGSSIFLYDSEYMHFHLGGRDLNAPNIPFENLLMVEAANWGSQIGLKKLHIGGGLSNEDSLFQYKKKFNRSGMLPFFIGRMIVDDKKYNELLRIRIEADDSFNVNNNYYIQYRF